jgi:hypothetical protein
MGAPWRVFDDIVTKHHVPLDSEYNVGLLWRIRRAMCWDSAVDRRRMVRMQLYALSIMLADAVSGRYRCAARTKTPPHTHTVARTIANSFVASVVCHACPLPCHPLHPLDPAPYPLPA